MIVNSLETCAASAMKRHWSIVKAKIGITKRSPAHDGREFFLVCDHSWDHQVIERSFEENCHHSPRSQWGHYSVGLIIRVLSKLDTLAACISTVYCTLSTTLAVQETSPPLLYHPYLGLKEIVVLERFQGDKSSRSGTMHVSILVSCEVTVLACS